MLLSTQPGKLYAIVSDGRIITLFLAKQHKGDILMEEDEPILCVINGSVWRTDRTTGWHIDEITPDHRRQYCNSILREATADEIYQWQQAYGVNNINQSDHYSIY